MTLSQTHIENSLSQKGEGDLIFPTDFRGIGDEVVKMLAQKGKIKIRPSGAHALNRLGLTTQVPTKLVYITNGNSKQFKLGKLQIKFKATSPKKLETIGEISSLLIQALEEIGTENIDAVTERKVWELLVKEQPDKLRHDLSLAPAKVNDYTYNDTEGTDFKGLSAIIDIYEYRSEILKVARQVKDFFEQSRPRKYDASDARINEEFWAEFDELVARQAF